MMTMEMPKEGRARAVIENVAPEVNGGRFPIKRVVGEEVVVEADAFADGHDVVECLLLFRREAETTWHCRPMRSLGNDRWRGSFPVTEIGLYLYSITAWVDGFLSWRRDFARRDDPVDIAVAARTGAELITATAERATGGDRRQLEEWAATLRTDAEAKVLKATGLRDDLAAVAVRHPDRRHGVTYPKSLPVVVDREIARFSAWYEMFPRSSTDAADRHGTFADCEARLEYIARMGFDVLYLPPVHPIGISNRKGPNNSLETKPEDVGSPWAIGAAEGGHMAVHPELGTIEDFDRLREKAQAHGIELALDIAYQCTPDHPYVKAHPDWFRWRPDGTVQYAENPPKKYQDIYPFDFESEAWRDLWLELKRLVDFWIGHGVRIFRVDNPHTKPFPFWEWLIGSIKHEHPDVLFLAEAFTRPKIMYRLAKLGFTQSYNYFAWRNTKQEITDYFTELNSKPVCEFFRANCWPNTPDILTEYLQFGGRAAFMVRLALAATLSGNYGIYGPAYELLEHEPREPGSEEYLDSEKYQIRQWELGRPDSLAEFIARINTIRRENPALQIERNLSFFETDNDQLLCYVKTSPALDDAIVVVVNLDPHHVQSGWVSMDLDTLEVDPQRPYQMHDLLTGARYLWSGPRNFIQLDPARSPVHIFRVRRRVRTERDFDYYL